MVLGELSCGRLSSEDSEDSPLFVALVASVAQVSTVPHRRWDAQYALQAPPQIRWGCLRRPLTQSVRLAYTAQARSLSASHAQLDLRRTVYSMVVPRLALPVQ